jgi:hypothetical protein
MIRDPAAHHNLGPDTRPVHAGHLEHDPAIVHEQPCSRPNVASQSGIADRHLVLVPWHILTGDREVLASCQRHRSGCKPAQPDLGALQIDQHAHAPATGITSLADRVIGGTVRTAVAMAHVQPGNIHARRHQRRDLPGAGCRGAKGAHDFRSAAHAWCSFASQGAPPMPNQLGQRHGATHGLYQYGLYHNAASRPLIPVDRSAILPEVSESSCLPTVVAKTAPRPSGVLGVRFLLTLTRAMRAPGPPLPRIGDYRARSVLRTTPRPRSFISPG